MSYSQGSSEVVKGVADFLRHAGEQRIKKWRRHVRMLGEFLAVVRLGVQLPRAAWWLGEQCRSALLSLTDPSRPCCFWRPPTDFPRPNNRSGELMTAEEFLCIVGFEPQCGGKKAKHSDD